MYAAVHSDSHAVYLGALLRNFFRTAGQLMIDFPTEEPEYWFLALHTAIVRQGPQQALESIEGLAQTDIRLLWAYRMEDAWMPAIDRAGMAAAAKSLIGQLRTVGDANVLIDWGLQLDNASQSVLSLQSASSANSSAKSFAAFESGHHELAISEADVALRFEANPDWISTVKAYFSFKSRFDKPWFECHGCHRFSKDIAGQCTAPFYRGQNAPK